MAVILAFLNPTDTGSSIDYCIVSCLVACPLNESEAGGDPV